MSEIPMLYAVQWLERGARTHQTSYHDTPEAADAEALRLVRSLPLGTEVTRFDLPEPREWEGARAGNMPQACEDRSGAPSSPAAAPNATDVIRGAHGDSEGVRA